MFDDLEQVMRCIINCSAVARTAFKNRAALYDLWRYLNLLHVTAYCGVTETYTRENLFSEFWPMSNTLPLASEPAAA